MYVISFRLLVVLVLDLNDDVHLNVYNIVQVAGSLVLDLNDVVYLNVCNMVQVAGSLVLDL